MLGLGLCAIEAKGKAKCTLHDAPCTKQDAPGDSLTVEQEQQFAYYFYKGVQLFEQQDYENAYKIFLFCQELNPNDAATNLYIGIFNEGMHRNATALGFFRKAYQLYPEEYWINYVAALFHTQDKDLQQEAIQVMEDVSRSQKDDPDLWDNLRKAYASTGDFKKALKAQDEVDRIEGYNGYSALNRYQIYVMMDRPKKAIQAIDTYLHDNPTDMQFLLFRVELLEKTKAKWQVLEKSYQQILSLDPNNIVVLNNYAYLLSEHKGDLAQAEAMSRRTIQAEPDNPVYLDTYAWILYLSGQKEVAAMYIRRAAENCGTSTLPKDIKTHYQIICK